MELDGIEYPVKTAAENTQLLVDYINNYCTTNNIQNSKGEVINIAENITNPLYIICYGLGYLLSIVQKLIYSVGCAFSISSSSDRQLLNLADIANVQRHAASRTTIPCLVYAQADTACTITTTLTVTLTIDGTNVVFNPAFQTTVEAGGVAHIVLISQTIGSYSISANTITAFDTVVTGLGSLVQYASVPGTTQETIADLRQRIQRRSTITTRLDRAAAAIQNLDGVSRCSIYFNYSISTAETINGISVSPRTALLTVQGYSNDIAKTFLSYLMCETSAGPTTRNTVQNYTTHAGQIIPINIVSPDSIPIYIKLYLGETVSDAKALLIKQAICTLATSAVIGGALTSTQVIQAVLDAYPTLEVQGAMLSLDNSTFAYIQTPASDQLFTFNTNNVSIEVTQ